MPSIFSNEFTRINANFLLFFVLIRVNSLLIFYKMQRSIFLNRQPNCKRTALIYTVAGNANVSIVCFHNGTGDG